jgi:hypothetical protein
MPKGISTSRNCTSSAACFVAEGIEFVVRYYSRTTQLPEKRLRADEALVLAKAGIDVVAVYQDRARNEADFGKKRGQQDATSALEYAARIGQPPGSAIYFAVDTDFSEDQIQGVVLPYFEGIKEVFSHSPAGYTIGVYGSGLTCRLLLAGSTGVRFAWLAEATGWRESTTYTGWVIKQFVNKTSLCNLADQWERCEAKKQFGQFRPLGSTPALEGRAGHMATRSTRLSSMPDDQLKKVIASIPLGTPLTSLGKAGKGWVRVNWRLPSGEVTGYVATEALGDAVEEITNSSALTPLQLPEVHLGLNKRSAARASENGRAYPLGEPSLPFRNPTGTSDEKRIALAKFADWMDVEHSLRYLPANGFTYCNVYATDYCYLARVYLPRVWWNDKALAAFARGTQPPVVYDQTVREMRADDLHAWLLTYGSQFGWRQVADLTLLQNLVNEGAVGVICADRLAEGRAGHITVVVPEQEGHKAKRAPDGTVLQPLQSQAGARNYRYGSAGANWWLGVQFKSFVMFVHD